MLGTCLHMMQGTPYIYEGEELGMTNADFTKIEEYKDVEALDIFRNFTERKGFSAEDTLELLHLKSRDNSVFYYYQKLVALRHELPVITDGVYELLDPEHEQVYAYLRKGADSTLVVLCNFSDQTIPYHVDDRVSAGSSRLVIANYADAAEEFTNDITLQPYGAYVYEIRA